MGTRPRTYTQAYHTIRSTPLLTREQTIFTFFLVEETKYRYEKQERRTACVPESTECLPSLAQYRVFCRVR